MGSHSLRKMKKKTFENHGTPTLGRIIDKKKKKKKKNKFKKIQDPEVSSTAQPGVDVVPEMTRSSEVKSTSSGSSRQVSYSNLWLDYKPRSTTLIKANVAWHSQLINEEDEKVPTDAETKKKLKELAAEILQQEVTNYSQAEERGSGRNNINFRKAVFSHGTTRDKLAAHVLRCMESPVHSLRHINAVISMVSSKDKGVFEETMSSVKDLFESTLIPKSGVLRKFERHSFPQLLPMIVVNRDQALKQLALWYYEDQLAYTYVRLIRQLAEVCRESVDINKLRGLKHLVDLVCSNPKLEADVILEAVTNKLGDPSKKVAAQTMHLLKTLLKKQPTLKVKVTNLVEMVLYRPNVSDRAQYYCLCFLKDMIFSRTDSVLATKLLKLYIGFFKACTKKGEVDSRLMGALLRGINRAFPYCGLTGDALNDHLNTLYQMCHMVNFSVATQALQLIYQVLSSKMNIADRFYQLLYGMLQDPAFGASSANSAFLNLLFKAIVKDESLNRVQAFLKRLLQVGQHLSSHMICGILFLISEVVKEKPELRNTGSSLLQQASIIDAVNRDETTECDTDREKRNQNSSLVICTSSTNKLPGTQDSYDPYHRNPLYCRAQCTSLWELDCLKDHYHPTVALFASKVISGKSVDYTGDPLLDFTLIRFLDRFVYKNPKDTAKQDDNAGGSVLGRRFQYVAHGARGLAVNTQEFSRLDPKQVPEDQQFLHRYFVSKKDAQNDFKDEEHSDSESVGDDEFDEYLSKMCGGVGKDDSDLEDSLDFAAGATAASKGDKESDDEMGETEDLIEGDDEIDGERLSEEGDDDQWEHFSDADDDDDDDDIDFDEASAMFSDDDDDDDGDDFDMPSKTNRKAKSGKVKQAQKSGKKNDSQSLESMFADADDFADLLEENADENMDSITTQAISNKDRAHSRQLKWEMDRDHTVKKPLKRGKQFAGGKNKQFTAKRHARPKKGAKTFKKRNKR